MTTIYFGTNRNYMEGPVNVEFGRDFSPDGLASLRFGRATFHGDGIGVELAPERLVMDKTNKQTDDERSVFGSQAVFEEVRESMAQRSKDTIVFIHGYNVSFEAAIKTAAQMQDNFARLNHGAGANVVLFSWPSDGSMMPYLAYANDRQDAAASGPAFARSFLKLASFLRNSTEDEACEERLHLVAHSMGNYVLRHALQEILRQSPGRPYRIFDQVLLVAADEDDDAFEKDYKLKYLPRIAKRVNVYFNNDDLGMAVSDKTKGNPDRLGDDGPRLPRTIPGKVSLIDCTNVAKGFVQHSYHMESEIVIEDILAVLQGVASSDIERRDYDQETNSYRLV